MGRSILSERVRFLDFGAYYLSPTQIASPFLEVRVNIHEIQSPLSVSFLRNPSQSVYGYVTTCYQECVYEEIQVRYDYQSVYRNFDSYQLLAQLECIYYGAITQNQRNIADANGAQSPYTTVSVAGLTNFIKRPVDSFRFKGINPCVFDFEVFWLFDDTDYGVCGAVGEDLPVPGDPINEVPPYDPDVNSDPNAADATVTPGLPGDENLTTVPEDSPGTDFSDRNSFPEPPGGPGTYFVRIGITGDTPNYDSFTANNVLPSYHCILVNSGGSTQLFCGLPGAETYQKGVGPSFFPFYFSEETFTPNP